MYGDTYFWYNCLNAAVDFRRTCCHSVCQWSQSMVHTFWEGAAWPVALPGEVRQTLPGDGSSGVQWGVHTGARRGDSCSRTSTGTEWGSWTDWVNRWRSVDSITAEFSTMHVVGNTMCSLTYTYRLKLHKMRYKVASCLCLRDYVAGYEYMRSNAPCTCNMGRHSGAWSQRRTRARSPFAGVPKGRGPNNRTATITIPLLRSMAHLQVALALLRSREVRTYMSETTCMSCVATPSRSA